MNVRLPPRRRALLSIAVWLLSSSAYAQAQTDWPTKAVRIIVPYSAGGVGDLGTRTFASRLASVIGQSVVVENILGGNQIIAMQALSKSMPDGHTLILASPTSLVLNPELRLSLPYAPDKLTMVSKLFTSPLYVITSNKLPARSISDFIAYAKSNPDSVNYVSLGSGSATHLATALFAQMAGIRMRQVPYKGASAANSDLMSGEVQVHFDPGAGTLELVKAGRLNVLATTGANRSRLLPNVPTVSEAGVPGYEVVSWWVLAAPEGTPKRIAQQIASAAAKVIADPETAEQGLKLSIEYGASTPDGLSAFVQQERIRWGGVIRTLGLKPQ